ncbi:MAG TPA: ABC transporter permease [Candidatus Limnocylindrales bacterium]|nr:ABC transporter permease [Candidatus Limnocylindrales bacterium]
MRPLDYLREAGTDLRSAKLRSLLTSLGIIIGVGSVVMLLSLGEGVRDTISRNFADLGSTRITVSPGAPGRGVGGGAFAPITSTLTLADVAAIRALDDVVDAEPVLQAVAPIVTSQGPRPAALTGTGPGYAALTGLELEAGRTFAAEREAMLSRAAADRYFPDREAVGATLTVGGQDFEVVGVVENLTLGLGAGQAGGGGAPPGGQNDDDRPSFQVAIYLPAQFVMDLVGTDNVSQIIAAAADPATVEATVERVEALMLERHGVEDFRVDSIAELLESFDQIFGVLTGFLAAIAGISLLVGGIGIMNIMLVVVTERTREIGIAKAIGATRRDIVLQFLAEAVLISLLGGMLGLLLAWVGVALLGEALGIEAGLSAWIISLALGVSIAIGVFFGVAPAWRAARMDPITALRHE